MTTTGMPVTPQPLSDAVFATLVRHRLVCVAAAGSRFIIDTKTGRAVAQPSNSNTSFEQLAAELLGGDLLRGAMREVL